MQIYRVEHKENKSGPYRQMNNEMEEVLSKHSLYKKPTPRNDLLLRPKWIAIPDSTIDNYRFGFESIEQLNDWFEAEEERQMLHRFGFVIRVYEADDVLIGMHQVVFNITKAVRIPRRIRKLISNRRKIKCL
jgi:hypothetical protein